MTWVRLQVIAPCVGLLLLAAATAAAIDDGVRESWLPDEAEIVRWHWEKDRHGPALTGNASWHRYLEFLERRLAAAGVVDLERNGWRFRRWRSSPWPDDSGWSLTVDGRAVPVASAGAYSGATAPGGVRAPLVLHEPGDDPARLDGRIAVLRAAVDPAQVRALGNVDYEFASPPRHYPWERVPAGGSRSGSRGELLSWRMFAQLMQTEELLEIAREGGAVGAVLVLDAGRELIAGLHTFPVPEPYEVPTLYLDREAGAAVLRAARRGAPAVLRLQADLVESEAYQLVGYLPGRDYGTPADEVIQLVTHTDGPAISQDNGALGLLGLVEYFARMPRAQRSRTLMVYLDCRHFMPGQEEAFAAHDFFVRHPRAREPVVAVVGMEHLGQIEYREQGARLVPSGRVETSLIWTTNDQRLLDLAVAAVRANALPAAQVRNVARPGVHGRSQGRWYGMASPARIGNLPAVAIMGTMGGYWTVSADIDRLDPTLFRRQLATFVQITRELMVADYLPSS